ncbi:Anaphase-promoting complex (APC), subunit 11 [Handroanthus impetiginosus]|uniref:RING-type E3 ubiquitin transferase n=1 Tax=Handroanthus impetiginosus TaxID=429701 RepID=A0A2G9I6A8_9LAMI|nr:Anaphase-promoting complex (APC), subunit 11 [Handroanthus impetiginosus]
MDLIELPGSIPMASPPTPTPPPPSYWCYQCTRIVTIGSEEAVVCPHCHGGFIQSVDPTDFSPEPPRLFVSPRRGLTRRRRNGSSFNPLIVLRSPSESESEPPPAAGGGGQRRYELYYDDGAGSGLRPLPSNMSESLLGSGFELMLDRLSQIGFSLWSRPENPPASKQAVASLPTIEILPSHVDNDAHCAVCTDAFTLGSDAREMPCKHIYHSDCIFPWLNLHNSCPVCRHELPSDDPEGIPGRSDAVGLTIWRLPGGGFAVGRFVGGADGGMPAVYSEVDGSLSLNGGASREIEWGPWIRRRRGGGLRRFFGNLGSLFRRVRSRSSDGAPLRRSASLSDSGMGNSVFGRHALRSRNSVHTEQ